MCNIDYKKEITEHINKDNDCIKVFLGDTLFLCFCSLNTVEIYRVDQDNITKQVREYGPMDDVDKIEHYCLQLEEQHVVLHTNPNSILP